MPMTACAEITDHAAALRSGLDRVVMGQAAAKERIIACLLAGGHALVEGVPGTAKTLLALTLSRLVGATFRRIQFTPDLMPVDLLGTNVYNQKEQEFHFLPGPVFTDVLLADEVNRTPPRTQSALLEAMQERAVTIDGQRRALSPTFFVLATQNPVEFEGTYPLPEAQRDRFLLKIDIPYPEKDDELNVLRAYASGQSLHDRVLQTVTPVIDSARLAEAQAVVAQVRVEDKLLTYLRDIIGATRRDDQLRLGAGPRAGIALLSISRALAVVRGRDFITPDDIKEIAPAVLAHRLSLAPEAEMEGATLEDVLTRIFASIEVPR
jgi:MoxR-like ATPase